MHAASETAGAVVTPSANKGSLRGRDLSTRELDVLMNLCEGRRPEEIATRLGLSIKTVATYRARLLEKTSCRGNTQLGIWAERKGLAVGVDVGR